MVSPKQNSLISAFQYNKIPGMVMLPYRESILSGSIQNTDHVGAGVDGDHTADGVFGHGRLIGNFGALLPQALKDFRIAAVNQYIVGAGAAFLLLLALPLTARSCRPPPPPFTAD